MLRHVSFLVLHESCGGLSGPQSQSPLVSIGQNFCWVSGPSRLQLVLLLGIMKWVVYRLPAPPALYPIATAPWPCPSTWDHPSTGQEELISLRSRNRNHLGGEY